MFLSVTLSRKIYDRRKHLGYSLRELAKLSGVPRSSLSRYERGEQVPERERICRIASALNTAPGNLTRPGE